MKVFILRNGEERHNGYAVVVAQDVDQARSLVEWDYEDETESLRPLIGFSALPPARVELQIYGD